MQMLKKSAAMAMTIKPAGANLPVDVRVAVLEGLCKALQEQLKNHEELLASVFKSDGRIELWAAQKLDLVVGGTRISIDATGIRIQSPLKVTVDSPKCDINVTNFDLNAGAAKFNAGSAKFDTGVVEATHNIKCETIQANNVVGANYTPGSGNVW
jgi:hypothetical protein